MLLTSVIMECSSDAQYNGFIQIISTYDHFTCPTSWLCLTNGCVTTLSIWIMFPWPSDRLCGLSVRVLFYRSGGPGSIPSTTRKKSSGSGTGSTQPCEYNWGATWWKNSGPCLENREYGNRDHRGHRIFIQFLIIPIILFGVRGTR
jgi:hypothetical protein